MAAKQTSISHVLTTFVVVLVVIVDQWTKTLVVEYLGPPNSGHIVPVIGNYLTLYYIQNKNSAMGLFTNGTLLTLLITIAIVVLLSLYLRMLHSGPRAYQLLFGLVLGGAIGNVIDRVRHSGSVVDFIFFRLPQLRFQFYIFNVADMAISVGIGLLLLLVVFAGLRRTRPTVGRMDAASISGQHDSNNT